MAIRRILCLLDGTDAHEPALPTALAIAHQHGACVEVLHVSVEPREAVPIAGDGMTATMAEDILASVESDTATRAERAQQTFERVVADSDVRRIVPGSEVPEGAAATFRHVRGREADIVAREGLLYDLIVVGRRHGEGEPPASPTLEAAIMETGRPVLLAPLDVPGRVGKRPAVAWRATVPGVHALHGALPMLRVAEHVPVITVDEGTGAAPGDVVRYLAFHGVRGEARTISAGGREAGNAILDAASTANADMLVMGAYAHSRLRQFILGGVTSTVLRQAALPLLLAH